MIRLFSLTACMLLALQTYAIAAHWRPSAGTSFSIILSVAPLANEIDTPAKAIDLDLFDTRAATVAALKKRGKKVICYLSAGSWENWRPDKHKFPAAVIGKPYDGWPGERWLDIRSAAVRDIMMARMDLCKRKGFHAVDADNVDGFNTDTGFPITRADAIAYLRFLAAEAHKRGLAFGLKNATELSNDVLDVMDFAVTEDCFDQGWCAKSKNFIAANKPVFAIEYTDNGIDFAAFCRQAKRLGLSPIHKRRKLDMWERRCP
jgi:hypothetical protein